MSAAVAQAQERTLLHIVNNPEYFALIAEAVGLLLAAHVMEKKHGGESA